jgi:uncharacterized protein (TIGR03086 family)
VSTAAALSGAVELLERSLAYTRGTLADVRPDLLDRPTPCVGWSLGHLLAHMEDALDAFTEAASGRVRLDPVPETTTRVEALREKACALLGAWAAALPTDADDIAVGDVGLDAPLLVATAALEITLHGWDVGQATGGRTRIPADLARGLLGVASQVIGPLDRGPRFACPRPVPTDASYDERLLAWTGRAVPHMTEPLLCNPPEPPSRRGLAS